MNQLVLRSGKKIKKAEIVNHNNDSHAELFNNLSIGERVDVINNSPSATQESRWYSPKFYDFFTCSSDRLHPYFSYHPRVRNPVSEREFTHLSKSIIILFHLYFIPQSFMFFIFNSPLFLHRNLLWYVDET